MTNFQKTLIIVGLLSLMIYIAYFLLQRYKVKTEAISQQNANDASAQCQKSWFCVASNLFGTAGSVASSYFNSSGTNP